MRARTLVKATIVILVLIVSAFLVLGAVVAAAMWVALIPLRVIARRQRKLDAQQYMNDLALRIGGK